MREPLNQFADRLVRNGEVAEFVRGLVEEKGADAGLISEVARSAQAQESFRPLIDR